MRMIFTPPLRDFDFPITTLAVAVLLTLPITVSAETVYGNLTVDDDTAPVYTEDLTYYTQNVGLDSDVFGIRIEGSGKLTVASENAFFTVRNMPDESGNGDEGAEANFTGTNITLNALGAYGAQGVTFTHTGDEPATVNFNNSGTLNNAFLVDFTAFGMKIDGDEGAEANFTGTNVTLNVLSANGAKGLGFVNTDGEAATVNFSNSGTLNITAVIEGDGIATTNAIGIQGGRQTFYFGSSLDAVNVSVYGSGVFNGSALFSNGTSGLYFRGDTVTIDAKALNVTVISGQDYTAQIETEPGTFETAEVDFNEVAAEALGARYAVTYGLNNKGNTTISADTTTTITVHDGFWNAVGISNDPMYANMDGENNYSKYNLSNLEILGNVSVKAIGSSLGAGSDSTLTGGIERLTATMGFTRALPRSTALPTTTSS